MHIAKHLDYEAVNAAIQDQREREYAFSADYTSGVNCLTKHEALLTRLKKLRVPARIHIAEFNWRDVAPPEICALARDQGNSPHVFLNVDPCDNNDWKPVDITWDEGLAKILPVNQRDFIDMDAIRNGDYAHAVRDMKLAVRPIRAYNSTKSRVFFDYLKSHASSDGAGDYKKNRYFYEGMNTWFAHARAAYKNTYAAHT